MEHLSYTQSVLCFAGNNILHHSCRSNSLYNFNSEISENSLANTANDDLFWQVYYIPKIPPWPVCTHHGWYEGPVLSEAGLNASATVLFLMNLRSRAVVSSWLILTSSADRSVDWWSEDTSFIIPHPGNVADSKHATIPYNLILVME